MTSAAESGLKGVEESALLPLLSRALESRRAEPLIRDERAAEIVAELGGDFGELVHKGLYHTIICLRARKLDAIARHFLTRHPDGAVIQLGCGLDTRFERVDAGSGHWVEVDLPAVIALRRCHLEESPRRRFVAGSLTDGDVLDEVGQLVGQRPTLYVAEGVLMFLPEAEVRGLILELARRSPGALLAFDAVKPLEVSLRRLHPTLPSTGAVLRWGLGDPHDLEAWAPGVRLVEEWFYHHQGEDRLGPYRWMRWLPGAPLSARVLTYRLGVEGDAADAGRGSGGAC